MRIYYDEEGDLLEISIGNPTKCYADEIEPGVFLRKDEETNEIKSIAILAFKKRTKSLKDIKVKLPIDISFSKIISG